MSDSNPDHAPPEQISSDHAVALPVLQKGDTTPAALPSALSSFLAERDQPMHRSPANLPTALRSIEATVVEVLRTIYDPEIPINIYDLGLIYEINVEPDTHVNVKMTLTAPNCPVAGSLPAQVESKIENIPEVKSADVELVWEPAWDKSRLSEASLLDLGMI